MQFKDGIRLLSLTCFAHGLSSFCKWSQYCLINSLLTFKPAFTKCRRIWWGSNIGSFWGLVEPSPLPVSTWRSMYTGSWGIQLHWEICLFQHLNHKTTESKANHMFSCTVSTQTLKFFDIPSWKHWKIPVSLALHVQRKLDGPVEVSSSISGSVFTKFEARCMHANTTSLLQSGEHIYENKYIYMMKLRAHGGTCNGLKIRHGKTQILN